MSTQQAPQHAVDLPPGYRLHRSIDLKKDRRYANAVQGLFVLVSLGFMGTALLAGFPPRTGWPWFLAVPVTALAVVVYMAAHEATHGILLHRLTGVRSTYAVRFPFLTTGNRSHLGRRNAVVVALAPCVLWGAVLVAALLLLPADAQLTAYILLALNFAGSAGDMVEAFVVSRQEPSALVRDDGDLLQVHLPAE